MHCWEWYSKIFSLICYHDFSLVTYKYNQIFSSPVGSWDEENENILPIKNTNSKNSSNFHRSYRSCFLKKFLLPARNHLFHLHRNSISENKNSLLICLRENFQSFDRFRNITCVTSVFMKMNVTSGVLNSSFTWNQQITWLNLL